MDSSTDAISAIADNLVMKRIALGIEYDGSAFSGWQIQDGSVATVQANLEQALSKIANHPVENIQVAGRTDAGVHATEQVMHFDSNATRKEQEWVFGTNCYLKEHTISVLWAKPVPDDFHARFSAKRRRYRYVILSRRVRPSFLSKQVCWERRPLLLQKMQQAAQYLVGTHDFNAYRTVHCQAKSAVKTVHFLDVSQRDEFFYIDIEANSFLHHMVRNIAGVLIAIGAGEAEPEWAQDVLASQDRTKGGITSSSYGLYLTKVTYDDKFQLPQLKSMSIV